MLPITINITIIIIAIVITNKETGKVIRQIPSEEMVRLSDNMEEFVGMIFNGRV